MENKQRHSKSHTPNAPLLAADSNKTSWKNGVSRNTAEHGTANEKVILGASEAIHCALMPDCGYPRLKEGDPFWTEAYEQALQTRIQYEALRDLVADLLFKGACLKITKCGKVFSVADFATTGADQCGDPKCVRCHEVLYGRVHTEIIGTGRCVFLVDESEVNLSRFRPEKTAKPFYYQGEK